MASNAIKKSGNQPTSIAAWLSVRGSAKAVAFYKEALGAVEVYHIEDPDGNVVARLSVEGAEFWVSDESPEHANYSPETLGGGTIKMILTVENPETFFDKMVAAGAKQIYPVSEGHGWKIGRVADPFGHHWEIGKPLRNEGE